MMLDCGVKAVALSVPVGTMLCGVSVGVRTGVNVGVSDGVDRSTSG